MRTPRPSRRQVVHGVGLAGLGLLTGCGRFPWQSAAKIPRLGYFGRAGIVGEFKQGLSDLGYVEGQHVTFEYRFGDGRLAQLPALAAELVRLPVDLILAGGAQFVAAAQQATTTIPIIGVTLGADPVAAGLVASLAHPGGNVTGFGTLGSATIGKRLQFLTQVIPGMRHVAVFWNADNATKVAEVGAAQQAATELGLTLRLTAIREETDIDEVFQSLVTARPDALLVLDESLMITLYPQIATLALQQRLPSINELGGFAEAGGLMSYGVNLPAVHRRSAVYVDKIIKGAKPADLPVEQPTVFDLTVNLKTAQALGLTLPRSVLEQATEVIQ